MQNTCQAKCVIVPVDRSAVMVRARVVVRGPRVGSVVDDHPDAFHQTDARRDALGQRQGRQRESGGASTGAGRDTQANQQSQQRWVVHIWL